MKNTKHYIKMLFSAALACVLCAGCGAPNEEAQVTATPIVLPTPTPVLQPGEGGEIVLPMPRNPFRSEGGSAGNPLIVNTEEMRNLYSLIYEPLLRCDMNNRLVPALAEKWTADDSGKVWRIELRDNVVWHEGGSLLRAGDVTHTIDLIRMLGAECYYAYLVEENIEQVEVLDEKTISVTMKRPGMGGLYALTFPVLCEANAANVINGTGPYKLNASFETSVELVANERWWRQKPFIPTVRFLARENNDVALDSLDAGQLNVVPTSTVSAGRYRVEQIVNVLDIYTQDAEILFVNHANSILRDLAIRQAILCALDRSTIIANVYMNKAAISDVPVPPDSFFYDPTAKVYDYNTTRAQELLASAGWTEKNAEGILIKDGRMLALKLLVNESTENTYRRGAANMIADQLLRVGIQVTVGTEKLSIGEADGGFEQKLQAGDFDLALVGINIERSGNLASLLKAGGLRNYGKFNNEEISLLVDQARSAVSETDIISTQAALQHAIVKDLPFITLYFRLNSIVYSAHIQGVSGVRSPDILRTLPLWYMNTVQNG